MIISVSANSDLPLYLQIERQIQVQVLTGALGAGDPLPSLRQLAADTGVSLITTKRTYENLEAGGWITSQVGRGTVVAEVSQAFLEAKKLGLVREKLAEARELAQKVGLDRSGADTLWNKMWEER